MSGAMSGSKIPVWRRVLRIPPHNTPRPRSFFGRQDRGVLHTPHKAPSHGWRMPIHDQRQGPRPPFGGSFVGRMQYAPTQGHVNAPRFMHTTTVKQSNAPHFPPPTQWYTPNAVRFSYSTTVKQSNALRFTYFTE